VKKVSPDAICGIRALDLLSLRDVSAPVIGKDYPNLMLLRLASQCIACVLRASSCLFGDCLGVMSNRFRGIPGFIRGSLSSLRCLVSSGFRVPFGRVVCLRSSFGRTMTRIYGSILGFMSRVLHVLAGGLRKPDAEAQPRRKPGYHQQACDSIAVHSQSSRAH
jgi:hypothetical protein